jgi:hypothetical protein
LHLLEEFRCAVLLEKGFSTCGENGVYVSSEQIVRGFHVGAAKELCRLLFLFWLDLFKLGFFLNRLSVNFFFS